MSVSVLSVLELRFDELDEGGGERSRLVRVVRMKCDFAVRVRAILRACIGNKCQRWDWEEG